MNPQKIKWIFDQVVNKIKNMFLRALTGSTKTCQLAPLEVLIGIPDISNSVINTAILTYLRLVNKKLWTKNSSRLNKIANEERKLKIPLYLKNVTQDIIKPKFTMIHSERPPIGKNLQTNLENKWFISMKTHKRGIKTSYSNPHRKISEGNYILNCKNVIYAFKFTLSQLLEKIETSKGKITLYTDNLYVIKNISKKSNFSLNKEIDPLNKMYEKSEIILEYQSDKNIYMNKLSRWTKCPTIKNMTNNINTASTIKQWIKETEKINEKWNLFHENKYAKLNIKEHSPKTLNSIIKLKKKEIKAVIAMLTGNGLFNPYREKIKISTKTNCRMCNLDVREDALHLLMYCTKPKEYKNQFIKYKNLKFLSTTTIPRIAKFIRKTNLLNLLTDPVYEHTTPNTT